MFLKSALVVAALIVAELFVFTAATRLFNPLLVTLVCVGLSLVGLQFLLKQAPGLVARTFNEVADGLHSRLAEQFGMSANDGLVGGDPLGSGRRSDPVNEATVANRAVKVFAAALLAFPGLLSGLIGMLLFVGPVRGAVASLLGSRLASLLPAGALSGRSSVRRGSHQGAVDVTATMKDPAPSSSSATGANTPELPAGPEN